MVCGQKVVLRPDSPAPDRDDPRVRTTLARHRALRRRNPVWFAEPPRCPCAKSKLTATSAHIPKMLKARCKGSPGTSLFNHQVLLDTVDAGLEPGGCRMGRPPQHEGSVLLCACSDGRPRIRGSSGAHAPCSTRSDRSVGVAVTVSRYLRKRLGADSEPGSAFALTTVQVS